MPVLEDKRKPASAHPTPGGRAKHVAPASLARKQEQERIDRDNKVNARKLSALKKEPPGEFHAPTGPKAIKGGNPERPGSARNIEQWPHRLYEPKDMNERREAETCRVQDNNTLRNKLNAIYKKDPNHNDHILANKLSEKYRMPPESGLDLASGFRQGVDCKERWALRTSLYLSQPPAHFTQQRAGVPKHLGAALCRGCGARGFFKADGVTLTACQSCKQVFYCSDTCRDVDFPEHEKVCKFETTLASGVRHKWRSSTAAQDHWVQNTGMQEGRRLLQHKDTLWPDGDATASIQRRVKEFNKIDEKKVKAAHAIGW
eukprot:CAMPEP_0196592198 /NCGR_PEP_ID=MMETSP1081-20130531/72035_1 /TAXON_ID=36882 /ORGANISM="Pyramimonas amylifera, Strain CCMP720" /LENGTH=315 /DNA_ID=CAMNT_0041915809 /DNA_START=161 /DNA_END=1105 /DNA_ORIENTATION=-